MFFIITGIVGKSAIIAVALSTVMTFFSVGALVGQIRNDVPGVSETLEIFQQYLDEEDLEEIEDYIEEPLADEFEEIMEMEETQAEEAEDEARAAKEAEEAAKKAEAEAKAQKEAEEAAKKAAEEEAKLAEEAAKQAEEEAKAAEEAKKAEEAAKVPAGRVETGRVYMEDCGMDTGYWIVTYSDGTIEYIED